MNPPGLVLDTSCLSTFARANQLSVLHEITSAHKCLLVETVRAELTAGIVKHPSLAALLGLDWLEPAEIRNVGELTRFALFKAELGGGESHNNGECEVLVLAQRANHIAIIDEAPAARIAEREEIPCHGTLWLLINAFRRGLLGRNEAEALSDSLSDHLRATNRKPLPASGAEIFSWAYEDGHLP